MNDVFSQLMAQSATCRSVLLLGAVAVDGKWVFVGTLGLVLIWLLLMPRRLIGQGTAIPPWWRNVRVWAVVICLLQMWVYWQFG